MKTVANLNSCMTMTPMSAMMMGMMMMMHSRTVRL